MAIALSGSLILSGSITVSGSIISTGTISMSGSIASASYANNATTASYALNSTSASFATNALTASSADAFTVRNTLTAQTLVVQTITSSVDFVTGSTRFGSILDNTHVFSGSVSMNPNGLFVSGSGLVGIGTITPSSKLDVYAGTDATSNLVLWGQIIRNEGNGATAGYGAGLKLKISSDGAPNEIYKWAGIAAVAGTNYSNRTDLALYSNAASTADATEKVRITGDGNVGIGTTDPQSKFDVTNIVNTAYDPSNALTSGQTMRIANTSTTSGVSTNLLFIATGAGGGNGLGSISGVNTGVGSMALTFGTRDSGSAVTERMRITSGGNVGIGTTSPTDFGSTYTVLCVDNATNGGVLDLRRNGVRGLTLAVDGGQASIASRVDGQSLVFNTNSGGTIATRLTIESTGAATFSSSVQATSLSINVAPLSDRILYISANLPTTGASQFQSVMNGTVVNAATTIYGMYVGNNSNVNVTNSYAIYIETTGGSGTITNKYGIYQASSSDKNYFAGNVGIGTSIPSSNLQINGSNVTVYDPTVDNGQDDAGVTTTIRNNEASTVGSFSQINMQVSGDSGRALGRIVTIRMASATSDMAFVTEKENTKSEKIRITSNGVLRFSSVPFNNYHLDTSTDQIAVANGGTIPFETFSGLIIVNNMSNGVTAMWLCGAGGTSLIGQGAAGATGTLTYSGAINGYVWTSNYGGPANYGVFAVRTRANA